MDFKCAEDLLTDATFPLKPAGNPSNAETKAVGVPSTGTGSVTTPPVQRYRVSDHPAALRTPQIQELV